MDSSDICITNTSVLTMCSEPEYLDSVNIHIKDGKIVYVGTESPKYNAKKTIDAKNCLVIPGLVNAHTHVSMSLFRGLADDLPLMTWLNDYIFPVERKMDAEFVYVGALIGIAEMLLSGTTTFCDMYLFEDSVAKAAKEMNVRCLIGEVLYDFPSPNYGPIEKGFEYTQMLIEKYQNDPLINIAVMPHATFTCSDHLLSKAKDLANKYRVPLFIHVSETRSEVSLIKEKHGKTPVGFLYDLGILNSKTIAAHCVHLSDDDIQILSETDTKVVFNPESNMKLASGIPKVWEVKKKGITCGIGTDGPASNNNLDLFEEMDTLAKLSKLGAGDPACLSAKDVFRMATIMGAKALGLDNYIGSIEVGKSADIVILDMNSPHLIPSYDPYSTIVYSLRGSDVRDVIVNGKLLVENGKLTMIDWDEIKSKAQVFVEKVKLWTKKVLNM